MFLVTTLSLLGHMTTFFVPRRIGLWFYFSSIILREELDCG